MMVVATDCLQENQHHHSKTGDQGESPAGICTNQMPMKPKRDLGLTSVSGYDRTPMLRSCSLCVVMMVAATLTASRKGAVTPKLETEDRGDINLILLY